MTLSTARSTAARRCATLFSSRRHPPSSLRLAARRADDDDDDDASNNNGRVVVTDQSCVAGERPCGWGSTREMLLHLGTTVQFVSIPSLAASSSWQRHLRA